jgi:hypothetical protein
MYGSGYLQEPVTVALVSRHANLIVATGGNAPTDTIAIVLVGGGEPVRAGVLASLNRSGSNVTGVSFIATTLVPKRCTNWFQKPQRLTGS